jgi:hypothetical protein
MNMFLDMLRRRRRRIKEGLVVVRLDLEERDYPGGKSGPRMKIREALGKRIREYFYDIVSRYLIYLSQGISSPRSIHAGGH